MSTPAGVVTRVTLYREALTPLLHRRFTSSVLQAFLLCYLEAILIGEKSSLFWSWFPFGPTGVRALMLVISALSVFVLRVASLHIGSRTYVSSIDTLLSLGLCFSTLQIFGWYLFSAWWFGEVFISCASPTAELGWIHRGQSWERNTLNERPIFLRSVFMLFAISQSVLHIYVDQSRTAAPILPDTTEVIVAKPESLTAWAVARLETAKSVFVWNIQEPMQTVAGNVVIRAVLVSCIAPFTYSIFIRKSAWEWAMKVTLMFSDIPVTRLSFIPPHYPSLILRTVQAGILLLLLWQVSNDLFTSYVARQPVKRGQPLSEASKDPNGTLINGLKSKKEIIKTNAFWELSLLVTNSKTRRISIFSDIDRTGGSSWSQICSQSLQVIDAINVRIRTYLTPKSATAVPAGPEASKGPKIQTLPRIGTPLRNENIFSASQGATTSMEKIESSIATLAKSYGQAAAPPLPSLQSSISNNIIDPLQGAISNQPVRRKALTNKTADETDRSPSRPTSESSTLAHFGKSMQEASLYFLRSSLGQPFRQTFARRMQAIILDQPTSSLHATVYAIKAVSGLAVASLDEDPYGRVSTDVPLLLKSFTATVQSIEALRENVAPHWTDVAFVEADRSASAEVECLLLALRSGLGSILDAFDPHAHDLGLLEADLVAARKVVARA